MRIAGKMLKWWRRYPAPPNQARKAVMVKPLTEERPWLPLWAVMEAEVAEVEMAEASDDGEDAEGEAGDEADEVDGFHGG